MSEKLKRYRKTRYDSMQCWDLAKKYGLDYLGDCSLIHGGYFYDSFEWEQYGYASVLKVQIAENRLFIDIGSIHRCEFSKSELIDCYGKDCEIDKQVEIEYCHSQWGVDPDYGSQSLLITEDDIGEFVEWDGYKIYIEDSLQTWIAETFLAGVKSS